MTLGLDIKLQDDMAEGVIRLNASGQITDFNRAAVPWLKYAIVAKNRLRLQIQEATCGNTTLPVVFEFPDVADPLLSHYSTHLCTAEPQTYALFIMAQHTPQESAVSTSDDADFFRLLGAETRHELTKMREMLPDVRTVQQSDRLSRLLVAFDQLSRLHQSDAFFTGERISLWSMVKRLIEEMPRGKCEFLLTPATDDKSDAGSAIYGDAKWMEIVLRTLLATVGESAPEFSKIEIRVHTSGAYVVLSSHFSSGTNRDRHVIAPTQCGEEQTWSLDTDIGYQICRRVVELHGGQLNTVHTDEGSIAVGAQKTESFIATFPLSAPSRMGHTRACGECQTALQMEKYAKDLAFVLKRPDAVPRTSPEELLMLSKLLTPTLRVPPRVNLEKKAAVR